MRKYLLIGFRTKEEAKARSREIALEQGVSPDATTKYWFGWGQLSEDEWVLQIPEDKKHLLRSDEQTPERLKEVQVPKFWHMKPPAVYRYMDQPHIDEFFQSGRLRLSSFALFAKHTDEQREDRNEGFNILTGVGEQHTMYAVMRHGHDAYILSTSVLESEAIMKDFGCDGYFRIKDSTSFGVAVANSISNFKGGIEGFCSYQEERVIRRNVGNFSLDVLKNEDDPSTLDMGKMFAHVNQVGQQDVFFVKLKKYQSQLEYRFVWLVEGKEDDFIFIDCPEAIQFCEKVT